MEITIKWQCTECYELPEDVQVLFECDICGHESVREDAEGESIFLPNRHCPECHEGKMRPTQSFGCILCFVGSCSQVGAVPCPHCGKDFPVNVGECCLSCQDTTLCFEEEHYPPEDMEDVDEFLRAARTLKKAEPAAPTVTTKPEPVEVLTEYKWCKHCQKRLPVSAFGRSSSSKDGLRPYCREYDREASARSKAKRSKK